MNDCIKIKNLDCSLRSILDRITPIEFIDNVLVINSPLTITDGTITIGETIITGTGGVLSLPEGTTVDGTPLLSPQYVDGVYVLPDKTEIDGTQILNVNYFYYYTAYTPEDSYYNNNPFASGYFINNCGGYSGTPNASDPGNYPFFAPADCVLTSLRFSVAQVYPDFGFAFTDIRNMRATIYTMSLSGIQTATPIDVFIAGDIDFDTRRYAETTFQYPIEKGVSVGIKVVYQGETEGAITVFATLGYKFQ